MLIQVASKPDSKCQTLIALISKEGRSQLPRFIPSEIFESMEQRGDFKSEYNQTAIIYDKNYRILLIGLGSFDELSLEQLRVLGATCMKNLAKAQYAALEIPSYLDKNKQIAFFEGLFLSSYEFCSYKKSTRILEQLELIGAFKGADEVIEKLKSISLGVDLARDLVNQNADTVTVERLVEESIKLSQEYPSVQTTVLREAELETLQAGLILAVAKGSAIEPALIMMEYRGDPDSKEPPTAFVGKGISFDTGGLNLKPTGSIETMKCDMAGAAAVIGLMKTVASLKVKTNILCVVASCENAIGPLSYKPGDVIRALNGKTVEVNNTDAEGRLVLADAVAYLQEHRGIKSIIDLATLTGAITIALGEEAAGLFTRSKQLEHRLLLAASSTGEKLWPMPLYDEFKEQLKSQIADMKNSGKRLGGASTGALFIESFIQEGTVWAHLDIAGVAYLSEPRTYHTSLATGYGVRLLINFLGYEL